MIIWEIQVPPPKEDVRAECKDAEKKCFLGRPSSICTKAGAIHNRGHSIEVDFCR